MDTGLSGIGGNIEQEYATCRAANVSATANTRLSAPEWSLFFESLNANSAFAKRVIGVWRKTPSK
jgi:hypothetical protein